MTRIFSISTVSNRLIPGKDTAIQNKRFAMESSSERMTKKTVNNKEEALLGVTKETEEDFLGKDSKSFEGYVEALLLVIVVNSFICEIFVLCQGEEEFSEQITALVFLCLCVLIHIGEVGIIFGQMRTRVRFSRTASKSEGQLYSVDRPMTFTQVMLVLGLIYLIGFLEVQRGVTGFNYFLGRHLDLPPDIRCLYCLFPHYDVDTGSNVAVILFYIFLCWLLHVPVIIVMCLTPSFEDFESFLLRQLPGKLPYARYGIEPDLFVEEETI